MPFNGSGTFTPLITFQPNTPATAEDQNSQDTDFASGLTNCITRDGQGKPTANLNMNNFRITNLANPVGNNDAVNLATASGLGNPTGAVVSFAGSTVPSGYLLCNGQSVSRTTYSSLFNVIGVTFGNGDGSTTFNIPNLLGRCILGVQSGSYSLGGTGGEAAHVLSWNEMPQHTHSDNGHNHGASDSGHSHGYTSPSGVNTAGSGFVVGVVSGTTGSNTSVSYASISISNGYANLTYAGSNYAHNNLQPYIALNFIIKT